MRNSYLPCLVLSLALFLSACGHGRGGGEAGDGGTPLAISGISADNAELLARSALEMISKVLVLGNTATYLIELGTPVLTDPTHTTIVGIDPPELTASGNGCPDFGEQVNEISYIAFSPGFQLPAGDTLHVPLAGCTMEGFDVTGTMDIAAVVLSNDRSAAPLGPWKYDAVLSLSPYQFTNANNTQTSVTDKITYSATMEIGTLTTRLRIAQDPDLGVIGGLNAEHFLGATKVNYQLRPFYIMAQDDGYTHDYSVQILSDPDGNPSVLDRYTESPNAEVLLQISTIVPIKWAGGRPALYTETPVAGSVDMQERNCSSCGHILATVTVDGVRLDITYPGGTITKNVDWATLLSTPDPG